nr:histone deacetylase 14 [Tanacetum cinerariifolium]
MMAAKNVPAKNVPALAPLIRFDDHILPYRLGAFTATATIPTIYIQQFWNTIKYYEKTAQTPGTSDYVRYHYSTNLDFAELLWEEFIQAIQSFISNRKKQPVKDNKKEPKTLFNPYSRFTKLTIYHLRSKHNFHPMTGSPLHIPDEDNVLGNLKFVTKGVKYEVFGMSIPDALITKNIRNAPYYSEYLEIVAKHERRVAAKKTGQGEPAVLEPSAPKAAKVTKPKATKQSRQTVPKVAKPIIHKAATPFKPTSLQPPKPKPAPTKPSKAVLEKKQKLVKKTPDKPSQAKRSMGGLVGKRRKPKSPLKLVDEFADKGGPAHTVVIQEPDSERIQSLPKKKSTTDQYFLQRRAPEIVELKRSSSQPKDKGITMTNSETESNEVVTPVNKERDASYMELIKINTRVQDEGQARSNPGKQDVGQDGSNPVNAAEFQP